MRHSMSEGTLSIYLEGRIDSNNAPDIEGELIALAQRTSASHVQLDANDLAYISSAGLRIVMKLVKSGCIVSFVSVPPHIYDVLDMTGFTEIVSVQRRPREVSLEGLQQIGAGAFGRVYRLDAERVIKVYSPQVNPLEKIEHERRAARQAFVHDIPSAIPFETVRVGDEYGIIYELIDAKTLGEAVVASPDRLETYAQRMAQLLIKLHATHFAQGQLPDARRIFHGWVDIAEQSGLYTTGTIDKLRQFVDTIPDHDTFVHGDFHPANIMVMPDDELLLIDMGDSSMGNPVIDTAGTYHVLRIAAKRPGGAERLTGMPQDMLERVWTIFVGEYFGKHMAEDVEALESRLAFAALPRTMGSTARSRLLTDEMRQQQARQLEERFLAGLDDWHWED